MTHICVSDLTSIGSDNGLSPGRRQAIIQTNAGILLMRPLGTNFSEFLVKILIFSFKKMRLKVSSAKRRPFCLGLNVLMTKASPMVQDQQIITHIFSNQYLKFSKFWSGQVTFPAKSWTLSDMSTARAWSMFPSGSPDVLLGTSVYWL